MTAAGSVAYIVGQTAEVLLGDGSPRAGLGVTVFGHFVLEPAMVGALGMVLRASAISAFGRQDRAGMCQSWTWVMDPYLDPYRSCLLRLMRLMEVVSELG